MLNFFKILIITIYCISGISFANEEKIKNIDKIRKAIVTINSRVPVAAYLGTGSWSGTGFIVDAKEGFLVTNNHVVGKASVGTYFVTFHTGRQAEAKVAYYDLYADFAVLKVEPSELPEDFEVIEFTDEKPALGAEVFIVGNTEGQGFSFHSGYLSDLYEISGEMPQGSYVINMNTAGGASGSPILNIDNKAIGVLYGGGKTHSLALKGAYVTHILKDLRANTTPSRKHIGVITELYSLDNAVKHRNFPKDEMNNYLKEFPDARNRVIVVHSTVPGGTAEAQGIIAGDIIREIDGKKIGADLCAFDLALNLAKKDKVTLTIIRNGKKINKEVALYDIEKNKVSKMIDFAGGLFFEADDLVAAKFGIGLGKVALANVQTGSSFSSIKEMFTNEYKSVYRLQIKALNGDKINSLDDLVSSVNKALKQKYINIEYVNFQPFYPQFSTAGGFISSKENLMQDITFDSIDDKPRILKFDDTKYEWTSSVVEKK